MGFQSVCVFSPPAPIPFQSVLVATQENSPVSQTVELEDFSCWDIGSVTELVPRQRGDPYLVTLPAKHGGGS